ncbi:phosphopantetheine-binding protein [Corynebacterium gerontici]|uniref:Phenyloxazoline synthase MbtB n=1 Tax=Corynebacterium gerontici TaxID=2079234 RepID=A0A3G6J267_9CORY|nr:phosphopantetheine-binding protein [Corynebacterium gerontici]AZA12117.1 Phenyloxazoline synthase MbtB [Corynebacterium gerontici]
MNQSQPQYLTKEQVISDIARFLNITEERLDLERPLPEQGLDSLRMITLIETWRASGITVDFQTLMSLATAKAWIEELST